MLNKKRASTVRRIYLPCMEITLNCTQAFIVRSEQHTIEALLLRLHYAIWKKAMNKACIESFDRSLTSYPKFDRPPKWSEAQNNKNISDPFCL